MKTIELSISDKNKSLLTHLQENGEFLPAYCACRGTCGKCKVQFLNNIPAYTTHDAAFFSAKELSEGWRLACQDDPATFMLIDRATKGPTETILFNIDIEG